MSFSLAASFHSPITAVIITDKPMVGGVMAITTAATKPSSLASALYSCCHYQRPTRAIISQMGSLRFQSSWTGLKNLSFSTYLTLNKERKEKVRGKGVYASLFGVGAPEALVIGVVALLVFGPKGLAEVARNLGKTLRAFQPTIRELQDVSREFKGTLEREIGLDDFSSSANNTYKPTSFSNDNQQATVDPNGTRTTKPEAYTSEDLLKITQDQLAASAASAKGPQAQEGAAPDAASKISAASTPEPTVQIESSGKENKDT